MVQVFQVTTSGPCVQEVGSQLWIPEHPSMAKAAGLWWHPEDHLKHHVLQSPAKSSTQGRRQLFSQGGMNCPPRVLSPRDRCHLHSPHTLTQTHLLTHSSSHKYPLTHTLPHTNSPAHHTHSPSHKLNGSHPQHHSGLACHNPGSLASFFFIMVVLYLANPF